MINHRKFLSLLTVVESCSKILKPPVASARFSFINKLFIFNKFSNQNRFTGFTKMGCSSSKSDSAKQEPTTVSDEEYVEDIVCQENDIQENEMKVFDLADAGKVLLVKQKGKINALGTKCTHYGAHLVQGALGDGRVRCQWHGACFNIETGDIEDFPGLDSLPCYRVTIEDAKVRVRAKRSELESSKRTKPMAVKDEKDTRNMVIIGGGPAGATCVETLRQENYTGSITLVAREDCLPYDRVKVSKTMDFEIEKAQFRTDDFYKKHGIDVLRGIEATGVDTSSKLVKLSNGKELPYDRLFIATGSKATKRNLPGSELKNVVVLRDYVHANYTNAELHEDIEVVISGSSYIAMEAAAYCVNKVKKVTVVARSDTPFEHTLGAKIGQAFLNVFKEKGVNFVTKSGLKQCIDSGSGRVGSVELIDGTMMKADLVVMGVGSEFYTDFLKESGVNILADGTIEVDDYLQSNVPEVYVGGDIAYAPVWSYRNSKSAIGHYPLAHYHGKIAALNMLNKETKLRSVPYFWTMLFGKSVRFAGHGHFDDVIYSGNVEELKFLAYYMDKDEVVAMSSCGMDPVVSNFAELLYQGRKLHRKDVENGSTEWTKIILPGSF